MNRKLMIVMVVILAGAIGLCACGAGAQGGTTGSLANAVFSEDFSDAGSGWKRASGEHGSTDYLDGAFHIKVDAAKYDLWSNPGLNLGDVSLEVDATKVAGPETNNYGLICRYQDAGITTLTVAPWGRDLTARMDALEIAVAAHARLT